MFRRAPATLVVVAATVLLGAYVAITPTHPLFALVTPAALLPVAYVIDTGTGPRVQDVRGREAAMLVAAAVAVVLAAVAFTLPAIATDVLSAVASLAAITLVAANWSSRRGRRRPHVRR